MAKSEGLEFVDPSQIRFGTSPIGKGGQFVVFDAVHKLGRKTVCRIPTAIVTISDLRIEISNHR
jgi:hypothetical protein